MIDTVDLKTVLFRPREILDALAAAGADFVVIGGVASALHGSPQGTADLDAVARRSSSNRACLARALAALEARPIVSLDLVGGTATVVDQAVDAQLLNDLDPARLLTDKGILDVMWRDETVGDFEAWDANAVDIDIGGTRLRVASVEDLIRSKERAGRDKDRAGLPFLREILKRRDAGA